MIRAVLFDYGGTLVTARKPWSEVRAAGMKAVYASLRKNGLKMPLKKFLKVDDAIFRKYDEIERREDKDIGDRVKYGALIDQLFPAISPARRAELVAKASEAFWKSTIKSYPLRKNARRCLLELEALGVRMGVISNHGDYESLMNHLESEGILPHFLTVLASEREGVRKPNPAIFARCLRTVGVAAREAVFVGDSVRHDVAGAKAAGMTSVLIEGEGAEREAEAQTPDHTIRDLGELPALVASLG